MVIYDDTAGSLPHAIQYLEEMIELELKPRPAIFLLLVEKLLDEVSASPASSTSKNGT